MGEGKRGKYLWREVESGQTNEHMNEKTKTL